VYVVTTTLERERFVPYSILVQWANLKVLKISARYVYPFVWLSWVRIL